jgi:DNA polymerase-1
VAVCFGTWTSAIAGDGVSRVGSHDEIVAEVARMEVGRHPRWVFWSAQADANPLVSNGIHLDRCWDIAEAHRILVGGRTADPGLAWATARRLGASDLPSASGGDLFDFASEDHPGDQGDPESPVRSDGYLRPEAVTGTWQTSPARALEWARAAVDTAAHQIAALSELSTRAVGSGIMLGPGHLFLTGQRPTGWLRFNVAFSDDARLRRFLREQIALPQLHEDAG